MAITTINSKGQVTIPKSIRDLLRLRPGDKLSFRIENDGTIRLRPYFAQTPEARRFSAEDATRRLREAFGDELLSPGSRTTRRRGS